MIDVAFLSDSNIIKKEHEKLGKYQGLKEELEKMWGVKAAVVPIMVGALKPKLGGWLQQILEHVRSQNSQAPRPLVEDPSWKETQHRQGG